MRCARRTKNSWLSIGRAAPPVSWRSPCESCRNTRSRSERVAELHAAELAVADRADVHRARAAGHRAHRHAELRGDLPPAELHGALEDQLGDIGEPVADLHQRQHAGQVGDRDAEHGGALEMSQHLHLALGILLARELLPCAARARWRDWRGPGSCDSSRSSMSSSSSSGWAAICSARNSPCAHSSTSRARAGPFSRSSAKYAERLPIASMIAEHPAQHRQLRAAAGDVLEQRRQQRLQAPAAGLIQLAHQCASAQLEQQPCGFGALGEAGAAERLREHRGLGLAVPEAPEVDAHGVAVGGGGAAEDHLAEVDADTLAVRVELGEQRIPVTTRTHARVPPARAPSAPPAAHGPARRRASAGGSRGGAGTRRPA